MTDKDKIRNIIELFIAWNGETEPIDVANIDSAVEFIDSSLQEEPVSSIWHDVSKETPTGFGKPIIVLCRNKNMEDGIWLADLIQDWEGEWEPRTNWETPVKWAYVKDLINLTPLEATNMGEQELVSEDLEETINTIKLLTSNTALLTFEYGFRKGAKWLFDKQKKVSSR
jgi:hypothetical protein